MFHLEVNQLHKSYGDTRVFEGIEFGIRKGAGDPARPPPAAASPPCCERWPGSPRWMAVRCRWPVGDHLAGAPEAGHRHGVPELCALPNMTVWDNVAFGLKMKPQPGGSRRQRAGGAGTGGADRFRAPLSGRALRRPAPAGGAGRALVVRPRILLLDEPLSALDARIRRSLRQQIREIQQRLELTTLFVTHDQEEALTLSDRIFLMNKGSIVQSGTPEQIYTRPASEFVAGFIGNYNLLGAEQASRCSAPAFRASWRCDRSPSPCCPPGDQQRAQPARHRSPATAARQRHPLSGWSARRGC